MYKLIIVIILLTICIAPLSAAVKTLYTYDMSSLARASSAESAVRKSSWDEMQAIATLQGVVNRKQARLYVYLVGENGKTDRFWLDRMRDPGEFMAGAVLKPISGIEQLVKTFRSDIRGVIIWDERTPATSNVASTIAGVEGAIAVRKDDTPGSLYHRLVVDKDGARLPVIVSLFGVDGAAMFTGVGTIPGTTIKSSGSAKCDAYLWAAEKYLKTKRCDPQKLGYYPDAYWLTRDLHIPTERTLLCNHDYFVAHRGFFFDLSPNGDEAPDDDKSQPIGTDEKTLRAILRTAYDASGGKIIHVGGFTPWDQKYTDFTGGKHGGVDTEWRYAEILSCFNAYMDADAPGLHTMANASAYQHYPLKAVYPQRNLPTEAMLKAKGYLDASGKPINKIFVSFYVGDYDSAAWLYERIPDLWNESARGQVPMGWAFNPTLAERFPLGLAWTRKTASPNDKFISGDSGAGYLNPGYLVPPRKWSDLPSGLAAWEKHCTGYYKRWDLTITGFVIDGYAPPMNDEVKKAYARFSPTGVVAQKIPERSMVDGVPFLRMSSDLGGTSEQAANTIANTATKVGPGFAIYRTILWGPQGHKDIVEHLKTLRPDIEVVDPYTLFLLMKKAN